MNDENLTLSKRMLRCLSEGVRALEPEARADILGFVQSCLCPNGGFRGRHSEPDLYYTAFAIDLLEVLGAQVAEDTRKYAQSFATDSLDLVHLACLARCVERLDVQGHPLLGDGPEGFLQRVGEFRAPDGSYELAGSGLGDSAYGSFLVLLAAQDLGIRLPMEETSAALLEGLESQAPHALTSPNIAAALLVLNAGGCRIPAGLPDRLLSREHPLGGFLAGDQAPVPDLLSTAVSLFALTVAAPERTSRVDAARHCEFVDLLWQENGGFAGDAVDPVADCEYTYYALLALGSLEKCAATRERQDGALF